MTEAIPSRRATRADRSRRHGGGGGAGRGRPRRRRFYGRWWFWLIVAVVVVLAAVAVVAVLLAPRVLDARKQLESAIPLASQAKTQIVDGDSAAAAKTVRELEQHTSAAREDAEGGLWKGVEWVPVLGHNLHAVRVVAETVDDLTKDALAPASSVSIDALKPHDGRIDVKAVEKLGPVLHRADASVREARKRLDGVDTHGLHPSVADGVDKLEGVLDKAAPVVHTADRVAAVLPKALGADGPRHYLFLFQNNAESRGTGGNPAALALITVDDGRIEITRQASSGDFHNDRATPIIPLDKGTRALYGTMVGRWMQNVTIPPDFAESADLIRAFWKESFGTKVDAVVSMDPVALSHILAATGPVALPTGETLTADNAVPLLLSEVYSKYPDPRMQDAFFAGAAGAAFQAVTSGKGDLTKLADALTTSVDEGRILYAPADAAEAKLIAGTRLSGELPAGNTARTMVGVYVDDFTEGKLDYYAQLKVKASSDRCTAGSSPAYTVTSSFTNTLTDDQVPGLAKYVSPARFFPKGHIATDLAVYGPVGGKVTGVKVDGKKVDYKAVTDEGRPAVKIPIHNPPGTTHTVSVTYDGGSGAHGPLEVWHTPMVKKVPVDVTEKGCG